MFQAKSLPKKLWAEAMNTGAYVTNCVAANGPTPFEKWFGKKPDIGHLRAFGTKAFAHVANRRKWDAKSAEMIVVGYSKTPKNYRLFNGTRVDNYKNVTFD